LGQADNDVLSGILEGDGVDGGRNLTSVSRGGTEHGGECQHSRCLGKGAGSIVDSVDLDGGTLHVHLTVSETVKPGPGNDGLSRRKSGRDGELERRKRVIGRDGGSRETVLEVTLQALDGVVSLPRLHHTPDRVLCGREVVGDDHLSGSSSVDGSSVKLKSSGPSGLVGARSGGLSNTSLAREGGSIGSLGRHGVGVQVLPLRRVRHTGVGRDRGDERCNSGDSRESELHGEFC
jgi:hypothetical protein